MDIQGHNDTEQNQSLKSLLVPSGLEVWVLFILSLIIVLALNYSVVWELFTDSSKLGAETASQSVQPHLDAISNFFKQEIFGKASLFLIWGCVGCIAYATIGAVQHFFWRVKEEVDESNYVKPAASKTYWYTRLAQYGYFVSVVFLSLVFVSVFLGMLLPLSVEMAETTIRSYKDITSYVYLLLGVGLMMLSLYALSRLWRALKYSFHFTFAKIES